MQNKANINNLPQTKLLTRLEAAEFLGITAGTLAVWACTKRYPLKYIKVGRLVKYREADLMDFLDLMTMTQSN